MKKKLFVLTWKRALLVFIGFVLASVLHNLLSAALGIEEGFFFIIAVLVIPAYLAISIIITLLSLLDKKRKK